MAKKEPNKELIEEALKRFESAKTYFQEEYDRGKQDVELDLYFNASNIKTG